MNEPLEHPEWSKENSLTSPVDRDRSKNWRPEQGAEKLTDTEVDEAMKSLNNTAFVEKFSRVDRTYADPAVPMQNIGLISFTPAKGAIPNKNGVYGFAKLRGNYSTPIEADERAEFIVRNVDSYHQIYHTYVGRPFPITYSSEYSAETKEVDIRREATSNVSSHIKNQKKDEQREVREMKEREEKMLEESKKAREDDGEGEPPEQDAYENYITLNVKKAQLSWTFLEHLRKLEEVRDVIIKTRQDISDLDENNPDFKDKYLEKYMKAREDAGLDDRVRESQDNFLQYMVEDVSLPTIDTDEVLPQIPNVTEGSSTTYEKK